MLHGRLWQTCKRPAFCAHSSGMILTQWRRMHPPLLHCQVRFKHCNSPAPPPSPFPPSNPLAPSSTPLLPLIHPHPTSPDNPPPLRPCPLPTPPSCDGAGHLLRLLWSGARPGSISVQAVPEGGACSSCGSCRRCRCPAGFWAGS